MALKILIVEDDQFFREAISDLLKKKNFEIFEASNGKEAQEIIFVQTFDIILSDIQMPSLTGIELLKWAKEKQITTPFILMTGFSMLLETHSAYDLGAKEFITKPFKQAELLALIEKIQNENKKAPAAEVNISEEYCKVSIEEFVSRPKIEFDIYIRLNDFKYAKIANKGDELEKDRLAFYQKKGVKHLYLQKQDFEKLIALNLNIGRIIKDRADISNEKKLSFLKYTGEVILEKAFAKNIDKSSMDEASTYLKITTDVITDSPAHFDLLSMLNQHSDDIYAHTIGVTLYSIMIAKQLGFESQLALNKISMAALFHDIGKKEISVDILNKPRYMQSNDERKIYESHVSRGKEILIAMKGTPADVIQIVSEHHEDHIGQGYPIGKLKKTLHPLSRILHCANLFVEQAMKDKTNPGCSGAEAILNIEKLYEGQIDLECIRALKVLYKLV